MQQLKQQMQKIERAMCAAAAANRQAFLRVETVLGGVGRVEQTVMNLTIIARALSQAHPSHANEGTHVPFSAPLRRKTILLSLQSLSHKISVNMQSSRKSPTLNSINVEGALGFVVEQPHVTPQPTRTPSGNILCSVSEDREVPALVQLDESEGAEVLGQVLASSPITAKYIFNS